MSLRKHGAAWQAWTCFGALLFLVSPGAFAQSYTWQQIRDKFEAGNPALLAGQVGIDEARAQEISAFLRPNPTLTVGVDQLQFITGNPYRPFPEAEPVLNLTYLHERDGKRELRQQSAQKSTAIAISQQADLERALIYQLRSAFVQSLQAKSIVALTRQNLEYYDHVLDVSRTRLKAGDIAQVDMDRLDLQRVQYETDLQNASVNLRTAKIQLLQLLNDRTPVDRFDVDGPFDFLGQPPPLADCRQEATENRPDLRAALQAVDKAKTDHRLAVANGSTDPTFGFDIGRNPPISGYVGFNVSIPLRIFDRNQGEKLRTQLDIDRSQRLEDQAGAQVFSDVDSAYATVDSTVTLLRSYKDRYLNQAARVRDTIAFSYQHGGASLLDFLDAENSYRSVQLSYLNLVGSYMTAASQLNLAVGREVMP